ncbi:putative 3-oxoacyl-(acyl-carrier protein) reductase [Leptomonas seymouri]|uniref:Putative 3-oxoacyl-(Acyl-carrier protein) reductase n=1 Tax=Leptomonas seymouri TaxID=5684 RepID=A0A0N1HTL2_LEPSE|nr:putative 3-oxoacyl-(acyl-carrier protein) reductase [Leptomonas seymouri]|eukprot:KPI84365.1 putative 3-oxoacyl-(acyl-carrier protein) reductase [Leptomonas seymouri]
MQSKFIQQITGCPIIVTGAASGLGAATARFLAQQGAKVTLLDRNAAEGEKIAKEVGGTFVATDVCSETDVQRAISKAQDVAGRPLFGAVNCAGICPAAKVVGKKGCHSLDLFSKTLQVNLLGTFNVCRLAAEAMQKNTAELGPEMDRGVIVNTASVAAYEGQVGQAAYAASKGGIVSLTLPLAREFASQRIRINTICPGIMETPLLPPAVGTALGATVPYPSRLGSPEEFAHLVYFILSNRYMNGECIRLDGAVRMAAK